MISALEVQLDASLIKRFVMDFRAAIAAKLRSLPRVTESDGSKWVNADDIEAISQEIEP